jgi:hypothetical protein
VNWDSTQLGDLQIADVFFSSEGPRLFTARNLTGSYFLILFVDEDEGSETYLAVPMSSDRVRAVIETEVSLHDAVANPEEDRVFVLSVEMGVLGKIEPRTASSLGAEWLPEPTSVLVRNTDSRALLARQYSPAVRVIETFHEVAQTPDLISNQSVSVQGEPAFAQNELREISERDSRSVAAIRLANPSEQKFGYLISKLAPLYDGVQNLLSALAQSLSGKATERGAVAQKFKDGTSLSLVGLRTASFVNVFQSSANTLFEDPMFVAPMEKLLLILSHAGDGEALLNEVHDFGPRVIARVRDLLDVFADIGDQAEIYLASPGKPDLIAEIGPSAAKSGSVTLKSKASSERILTIDSASLIASNLRTGYFEVIDDDTKIRFTGKAQKEKIEQLDGLPLGGSNSYRIELLERDTLDRASDTVKSTYSLSSIRMVGDNLGSDVQIHGEKPDLQAADTQVSSPSE